MMHLFYQAVHAPANLFTAAMILQLLFMNAAGIFGSLENMGFGHILFSEQTKIGKALASGLHAAAQGVQGIR